jgi:hypothetical protein
MVYLNLLPFFQPSFDDMYLNHFWPILNQNSVLVVENTIEISIVNLENFIVKLDPEVEIW